MSQQRQRCHVLLTTQLLLTTTILVSLNCVLTSTGDVSTTGAAAAAAADAADGDGAINDVIQMVYFTPDSQTRLFTRQRVSPAIDVAIEKVRDTQLLPRMRFETHFADTQCNGIEAPLQAFDYAATKTSLVFLGPVCDVSCAPVALFAPRWQVPVISPGAMTYAFGTSKSDEYQTLTRVGAAYLDVAIMIDHILKRYHWHKTAHIYHSLGQENISPALCFYVMDTLGFLLKHHAVDFKPIPIDPSKGAEHFGEKLLHEVGTARSSKQVSVSPPNST